MVSKHPIAKVRWSNVRFFEVSRIQIKSVLYPGNVFFRRQLWEQSGATLNADFVEDADVEMWCRMMELAKLYPVYSNLAGMPGKDSKGESNDFLKIRDKHFKPHHKTGALHKMLSSTLYPFYIREIPFLRFLYQELYHFPAVVRFEFDTDSFYLSRY